MSDDKVKVTVEVTLPKFGGCGGGHAAGPIKLMMSGIGGDAAIHVIDPLFVCKVSANRIQFRVEGTSLKLAGFGYPVGGFALQYVSSLSTLPVSPEASSVFGPKQAIVMNTTDNDGTWYVDLEDYCSPLVAIQRKLVVWFTYGNVALNDSHSLIDARIIQLPKCGDVTQEC